MMVFSAVICVAGVCFVILSSMAMQNLNAAAVCEYVAVLSFACFLLSLSVRLRGSRLLIFREADALRRHGCRCYVANSGDV